MNPPFASRGQTVIAGPERRRHELVWQLTLGDGRRAVLAQLVPELARDEALRRRYVLEAERLLALDHAGLGPLLAIGPAPEPRDPAAEPPWRLRLDPDGDGLDALLARRAPLPVDEALALVAAIADAVHGLHAAGVVACDLEPARIRLAPSGAVWLLDVGASRFATLSSRTASSMLLESSPYAAPEHLRTTVVDPRVDVFSLGVILWHALVGELPFGDAHEVLRGGRTRPALDALCFALPPTIVRVVEACLAADPRQRPSSARELAEILRGERGFAGAELARVVCQACGKPLRAGLRLCLACGREAVQLHHVADPRAGYAVILKAAREDEAFDAGLEGVIDLVGDRRRHPFTFVVGDRRMYSKDELGGRIVTPVAVFTDLPRATARDLADRLTTGGLKVEIRRARPLLSQRSWLPRLTLFGSVAAVFAGIAAAVVTAPVAGVTMIAAGIAGFVAAVRADRARQIADRPALARLRATPAALPASDPLVAQLAAALADDLAADVRECVAELALLTQRAVDHRARSSSGPSELTLALEPLADLVVLAAAETSALARLDAELAGLDEGALVRALATSRARGEAAPVRGELLAGLDRLRALEDRRTVAMRRLLVTASLVRRAVELAGAARDSAAEEARLYRLALAELGE